MPKMSEMVSVNRVSGKWEFSKKLLKPKFLKKLLKQKFQKFVYKISSIISKKCEKKSGKCCRKMRMFEKMTKTQNSHNKKFSKNKISVEIFLVLGG